MNSAFTRFFSRRSPVMDAGVLVLFGIFMVWSFAFMSSLMDVVSRPGVPTFAYEILSGVTGSFITVIAMGTLMHFQGRSKRANQFSEKIFEEKLAIYRELLYRIFRADDDNRLTRKEILEIEDAIGVACLVGNERVVALLSQFAYQLKVYGVVYYRSLAQNPVPGRECPRAHFEDAVQKAKIGIKGGQSSWLQSIPRESVEDPQHTPECCFVSLDQIVQAIRDDLQVVEGDISGKIQQFMEIGYDPKKLIRHPNSVEIPGNGR